MRGKKVQLLSAPYGSALAQEKHRLGDDYNENTAIRRVMAANAKYADIVMAATFGARNLLREEGGVDAFRRQINLQADFLLNAVGFEKVHGFFLGPYAKNCYDGSLINSADAKDFHGEQLIALQDFDCLPWFETFPTINDAVGAAMAARKHARDVAINFVVGNDGNLKSGESVTAAIRACESFAGGFVRYYGVNCCSYEGARKAFENDQTGRLNVFYMNGSDQDPATLEGSCEVVKEDVRGRISQIEYLIDNFPQVAAVGGCCGFEIGDLAMLSTRLRK